mmetsp:Transcript_32613/g.100945  ORF Transcript_32613/g.100945 Transcript_32613/m.100945 type:complete len:84 (+) Transcript_32613:318-569(+)
MKSELHEACARGLTGDVQLCLDRGADVHFATYDGTTALHIACKRGYVGVATLCLEHGAVVDSEKKTTTAKRRSPTHARRATSM